MSIVPNTETNQVNQAKQVLDISWFIHKLRLTELEHGSNVFVINLQEIADALDIRKDALKRVLKKTNLRENFDFILLHNLVEQKTKDNRGGHNAEQILLTIDAAKMLAMQVRKAEADQFRRYFIEAEKQFYVSKNDLLRVQFENEELKKSNEEQKQELKRANLKLQILENRTEEYFQRYLRSSRNVSKLEKRIDQLIDEYSVKNFLIGNSYDIDDTECIIDSYLVRLACGFVDINHVTKILESSYHFGVDYIKNPKNIKFVDSKKYRQGKYLVNAKTAVSIMLTGRSKKGLDISYFPENLRQYISYHVNVQNKEMNSREIKPKN